MPNEKSSLIHAARVYLAESIRRRGQLHQRGFDHKLLTMAGQCRRRAAAIKPAAVQGELF